MAKTSFVFSALILLLLVLAISELETVRGKLCEKPSKTFSGKCDNKQCDKKCKDWEKAVHGACHKREAKDGCFCYFDCGKDKKTPPSKGGSPPPPSDGGSPPPPSDGGSPPPADGGSPPPADGGSPPADGGSPPPPSAH